MKEQPQNNHPLEAQPEGTPPLTSGEGTSEAQPAAKFKLSWQFAAGLLGWYLVTTLVYWLEQSQGACLFPILFPLNLVILVVLLRKQPQIGWGMLSALGLNMLISLVLDLFLNAVCFIPFFTPVYW